MNPDHAFFSLLRASLWGHAFSPDPDTDISSLYKELRAHAIANLAADTLAEADPKNRLTYAQSAAKGYRHWYGLMQVQQDCFRVLEGARIPCCVLKGAAAAIYYPQPMNRTMGDIDLLVQPKDIDRAVALLLEDGCTLLDDRNPRHTILTKNKIHIEVHRQFTTLNRIDRARMMDDLLFSALAQTSRQQIEGFEFTMLPPAENGLVLMEHINSHMASGLGLRQIIDWMYYVHQELDDNNWQNTLGPVLSAAGLKKLAVTVTRMCQIYLGLREDITWCREADDALCHKLMAHTLMQGNFGRKQNQTLQGTMRVLNALDSDLNFFQLLHRHGCYNWKAVRKHPWLKPFAWIYQLCRYIRKAFRNGLPIGTLRKASRQQKRNTDLLDELEVMRKDPTL